MDQWFGSPHSLNIGSDFGQVQSGSGSNLGSELDSATTRVMQWDSPVGFCDVTGGSL
jgi:hypothetical protein